MAQIHLSHHPNEHVGQMADSARKDFHLGRIGGILSSLKGLKDDFIFSR